METNNNTILIIEDDADLIELLNEIIENSGYQTFCVQTAGAAFDWLIENTPFLIILDYSLPDMNGKEFIAALTKNHRDLPPFIVSTGQGDERIAVEMMKLGARDYIIKDNQFLEMIPLIISKVGREIENENKLRLAQQALRISEERYRSLFFMAGEGIFIMATDGKLVEVNESFARMHGYTVKEILEMDLKSLDTNETGKLIPERMSHILKGEHLIFEVEHFHKNGHVFPLEVSASLISHDGNLFIQCFHRDISRRKHVEEALKESELKYRSLIECSSDAIFCVDENGRYKFANNLFAATFGQTPDYFVGKTFWDIYDKEHADYRYEATKKLFLTGVGVSLEVEVPLPDKTLYFLATTNPVKDETGKVILNLTHATDITGLKHTQEVLKTTLARHEALLDAIPDMMFVIDAEGAIVDFHSDNHDELYLKPETFHNKNVKEVLPKEVADLTLEKVASVLATGQSDHSTYTLEITGTVKHFESRYVACGDGQVLSIVRDITDRRQAEQELIIAKERAEESDRLKSAFLANMSHEIRTPMNGILGFASLLKEPGLTGEEQQKYIRIIEKGGARMLNIINDIVDISKIESGQMEISISETNINQQIEFIYIFFKPEVEKKGIKFSFKNPLPTSEAFINTDREKIYAILTNLVKNAIKYTNQGSIEFGYKIVETQCIASLQFFITDTGIGIPKDRQQAIFDRFVQADIEDRNALQGAGLGLSITKAYIEMLGGAIRVESEPGKGSTFYFTIPYNTGTTVQTIPAKSISDEDTKSSVRKLKILIAEDDETSEELISAVIKGFCKEILTARTGTQAIETCRNNPDMDLILMDIQMPEVSGYEATRQIRQFNKEVVIIAQTAYGLTGDREKSIAAGCNEYISKPIRATLLKGLIQSLFKKQ
ncbi:MAG: PAS domain S-box protein [Bacteroidota bacterium]